MSKYYISVVRFYVTHARWKTDLTGKLFYKQWTTSKWMSLQSWNSL